MKKRIAPLIVLIIASILVNSAHAIRRGGHYGRGYGHRGYRGYGHRRYGGGAAAGLATAGLITGLAAAAAADDYRYYDPRYSYNSDREENIALRQEIEYQRDKNRDLRNKNEKLKDKLERCLDRR